MDPKQQIEQSLATANNYLSTNRPHKAIDLLVAVKRVDPDNENYRYLQNYIISTMMGQKSHPSPFYGINWKGESLDGKSIEIFCDQGMGDTIQMLRYVWWLKREWKCKVVLNCYAFHCELEDLFDDIDYIDEFVNYHVACDYYANIMSLAYIINDIDVDFYYPTQFRIINDYVMDHSVIKTTNECDPSVKSVEGKKIGIAWRSNVLNKDLEADKSIPVDELSGLTRYGSVFSLIPDRAEFVHPYCVTTMGSTAALIKEMDIVVSVDTAVLHLAGSMGVPTLGLLCKSHDCRWGENKTTPWYYRVLLYRQEKKGDWNKPIETIMDICDNLPLKNT